ncbi:MAG: hypothetical protein OEW91_01570 [Acidimicrobiia bacterium]|nr:hypothetical protein [Acidimicrobiia bacterium]
MDDQDRNADRRRLRTAIESISLGRRDLTPLLPRISVPTLIITGVDDVGFTPDQAAAAATSILGAGVSIVGGAGPVDRRFLAPNIRSYRRRPSPTVTRIEASTCKDGIRLPAWRPAGSH